MTHTGRSPRATLTLIGTVHRDRRGEGNLARLLEQLAPDRLTLEMSPAALSYRQQRAPQQQLRLERILERLATAGPLTLQALQAHTTVADIYRLLALPFEYTAAAAYAANHHRPLGLIDDSEISQAKLSRVEGELITLRNLRVLTSLPPGTVSDTLESYASARSLVLGNPPEALLRAFLQGRRGAEGIGARDQHMAATIRQYLEIPGTNHLLHIGGWVHLLDDPSGETLYSRLVDLQPRRLLLEEEVGELFRQENSGGPGESQMLGGKAGHRGGGGTLQ